MRLREKRRPVGLTGLELIRKLYSSTAEDSWGRTILYWALRHLEEPWSGEFLRHGQPSSVQSWMVINQFWNYEKGEPIA